MQFVEITNEAGAVIEIPVHQVSYAMKLPMEREYILALRGAAMKVNGAASPFDPLVKKLLEATDVDFKIFPIPEGTDAVVNPENMLFMTSVELGKTALMYSGGIKIVVNEGINTVRGKLTGKSIIQES